MSLTTRVLLGLAVGFAIGLAIGGSTYATPVATVLAPVGTVFINLIRMTALPLVASMLVASVGSIGESRTLGRTAGRALAMALLLLTIAAAGSAIVAAPVFGRVHVDREAAEALRPPSSAKLDGSFVPRGEPMPPSPVAQWFIGLVSPNVFKSAVEDAMLPVIIFAVLFALALGRIDGERRTAVLRFVDGVAQAMQRLVTGILAFAPVGVFALAVPLAARLGLSAIAAVGAYIALVVVLTVAAVALLLYPLGIVGGRMRPSAFAAFCAPAQAMAFSSRSSVATLPAMLETASRTALPPIIAGFIIPLGASVFRFGAAVAQTVGVLFLARLYGVELSTAQIVSIVVTVVFTTFAVPGIPGGSIIAMVPVLASVNLPVEGIGVLLAVDTVPDMFRTTANATGTMTLAAVLRRSSLTDTNIFVEDAMRET
ncbi:MAG TPA: dicarboxylate/amino acid:cation symporter [Vicinamibacterales bacterium]|nr:dicarboxylate/amino acid:cation symporter [Vicinamibacterales bacterium]